MKPMLSEWNSTKQARAYLNISHSAIMSYIKDGTLKTVQFKANGKHRISRAAIEQLEAHGKESK